MSLYGFSFIEVSSLSQSVKPIRIAMYYEFLARAKKALMSLRQSSFLHKFEIFEQVRKGVDQPSEYW